MFEELDWPPVDWPSFECLKIIQMYTDIQSQNGANKNSNEWE